MDKEISNRLITKAKKISEKQIKSLFESNPDRGTDFSVKAGDLWLNYSRNHLDFSIKKDLLKLAEVSGLKSKIIKLYSGEKINQSESRSVLHPLLRAPLDKSNPNSVIIYNERKKIISFAKNLKAGDLFKDNITDIICIGIGGSELGVKVVYRALMDSLVPEINLHFIANIDGAAFKTVVSRISFKNTIFLITSKTFTTFETIQNFSALKDWSRQFCDNDQFMDRCYAITANSEQAIRHSFKPSNIFKFWDWVGGRFSVWSAVGLPIILAYGDDVFNDMLNGAWKIDQHFINTDFSENMPVLLGMIHIWYTNFLNYSSRAVIPYAEHLDRFPSYLQQLEMESLGKSVDVNGDKLTYNTSPIVWGSSGSNGQHAFFQLLHQGSQIIPVDFIAATHANHLLINHHNALLINCLAQSKSLMLGGETNKKEHGQFSGNRPSNLIIMDCLSPSCLGQLLALYEHKVFVQSVVWNINAFDQWGVELGKSIASIKLSSINSFKEITFEQIKSDFLD